MMNVNPKIKAGLALSGIIGIFFFVAACDMLGDDISPNNPNVEISEKEFHILSNGNAYIDLHSLVKTNGRVSFNISSSPNKGQLSTPAKGMLRYAPFNHFKRGKDSFAFSIFGEDNKLLLSDTVIIIVEDDTTNMPCGYFPADDYVYSSQSTIVANVLANDYICGGDSSKIKLEIYRPDNSFPPHSGTATVVDNRIVYTTGATVASDTVVYKISNTADNSIVGYATLFVNINSSCTPQALYDYFEIDDQHGPFRDSVELAVLNNDIFCNNTINNLSVVEQPVNGRAGVAISGSKIYYSFIRTDSTAEIQDSLRYQWCIGSECYTGRLKIKLY